MKEHLTLTLALAIAPDPSHHLFSASRSTYNETNLAFTLALELYPNSKQNHISPIHLPKHRALTLAQIFGAEYYHEY